ncbi:DNA ligase [Gordonibacter sp. Marseille-P4307]|uniref:DNA ligase n=1 Tax=Gordonibacter sp. Marseille-P4307 TaxID=2161815 RepID=UPI000F52A0D6|nr:DNA ligase [Gordonibacter sp. Marseille-P4307]
MTNEQLITAIRDIKSATSYIDAVVDQVIGALGGESVQTATQAPEPQPQLKLEDVRAILADMSRAGYTAQIRALLGKYGAAKLSEVDPAHYAALLQDAEAIGHE